MPITTPVLSYLQNPEKTLPMLLIEAPTTAGRTIQGYKHGGAQEGRERICEETLGAAVWLFGIKTFNKMFDFVGEKVLGLKELGTDVGKDSLRDPFQNVKDKKGLTAGFKFGKIAASTVLGILAMGAVVPKLKQAMTNAFREKQGLEPLEDVHSKDGKYQKGWADKVVSVFIRPDKKVETATIKADSAQNSPILNSITPTMDEFINDTKNSNQVSFKGGGGILNGFLFASHNLENNAAWRLLSTDAGTLAGRVGHARNKKEAIEYAFRDSVSSLFYVFAAPIFSSGVRKLTNTPDINPKGAEATGKMLKDYLDNPPSKGIFGRIFGTNKPQAEVPNNFFSSLFNSKEDAESLVSKINFREDGTIWLDDFNKQTKFKFARKAHKMSELQPMLNNEQGVKASILSRKQVQDIMSHSPTSDPEFLKSAISQVTEGKSDNPRAFVSRKNLEKVRDSFDDFVLGLEKYAKNKTKDGVINKEIIDKYTNSLNRKNLLIHLSGIAFAVFGLAYLIPKLQYIVSDKLTGTKGYSLNSENNQNKNAEV